MTLPKNPTVNPARNDHDRWSKRELCGTCLGVTAMFLLCFGGCRNQQTQPAGARAVATPSVVEVQAADKGIVVLTPAAKFVLSPDGAFAGYLKKQGTTLTLEAEPFDPAQIVTVGNKEYAAAVFDTANPIVQEVSGKLGERGKQVEVAGKISGSELVETLTLEVYDAFPQMAIVSLRIRNGGPGEVMLEKVALQRHSFRSKGNGEAANGPLWTFEGASLDWGKDEIFRIPAKFQQENPFGAPVKVKGDLVHVGGGIPVVAFWSGHVGEAIGHIETLPLVLSIPVQTTKDGRVAAGVSLSAHALLKSGEVFSTPRTFLAVYAGDYYEPLKMWSDAIEKEGLTKPFNNDENYAVSWCGWGYEFGVTPKQMLDTIPKLKELGIHWATLDDGWFNNYGDYQPREPVFAGKAIEEMVQGFHAQGIKVQLWWLPLAAEDGRFGYDGRKFVISNVVREHPDWLILDRDGRPARMARNLAALCPALPEVRAYTKQLTERFIRDWGFDGHKLDNIYTPPLCYNPKHHHTTPYDSVYAMGDVYKTIFETTRALKPYSVTQSCPCGTPPSLAWIRYMDQAVTADPVGSIQVRRRVKMYKALLGPRAAVYGDHVELTRITNAANSEERDLGTDFASTLGTGGVLGTKFTWPDYGPKFRDVYLTPEKEAHWKRWIGLYNEKMLSQGTFRNLYVYGFDIPEAYAIEKKGVLYYAFYAPGPTDQAAQGTTPSGHWQGEVELRGLEAKTYRVADYAHGIDYGKVTGPIAKLKVEFTDSLLVEAVPAAE